MNGLSIIIPVYNTEKYLVRCLESVCSLKNDVFVILIDDGSTDNSGKICDSYVEENMNFSVVHKHNEGLVLARKNGIDMVKTEYFTFIDSDDYIDSGEYDDMIDELFQEVNKPVDIICTGMIEEYMGNCYPKQNKFPPGTYSEDTLNELYYRMLSEGEFFDFGILPNAVCKIYRTAFVKNNPISISSNVVIGEDADMTFQLMVKAEDVLISDYTPYHYCRREDSMMWKKIDSESIDCLERDLRNAFDIISTQKESLMRQLCDYMAYISLLCDPQRLFDKDPFFMNTKDRIALYGAGGVGKAIKYGMSNSFPIWVDRNYSKYQKDEVLPVESLIQSQKKYDKVFIALSNVDTCRYIKASLIDMGISKPIYYYGCVDNDL